MARASGSLDSWRDYFRTANSDIFGIIHHAILVAASDCPKDFRLRRDQIAETLFSTKLTRCSGCDRVELALPVDDSGGVGEDEEEGCKSGFDRDDKCEFEPGGGGSSKESKVNSCRDVGGLVVADKNQISNYSYGEAEALTDEIEEEGQIVGEVLRIKELLSNSQDESDSVLFDSLRRLQLMALSVDTLKATEIGKAVNGLRRHGSKEIRHLARTLIEDWKHMVDEWVNAMAAIEGAEDTPESVNPSVVDYEEGLPSPPMDVGAFFASQNTSMELSQFFDGMDFDGNPRSNGDYNKNRENVRKPSTEKQSIPKWKQEVPDKSSAPAKEKKVEEMKKQENAPKFAAAPKPHRPPIVGSGPGRPIKHNVEQKVITEAKLQKRTDKLSVPKRPMAPQQDKLKSSDDAAVQVKLEATKRKLQERYQQHENAKKQRTIQVMELHDIPKQGHGPKHPHVKPGNHNNRQWANGRR